MTPVDVQSPLSFLRVGYHADDWLAVFLKSSETGSTAQRVGPMSLLTGDRFQAWLRARNRARCNIYVSVNALTPARRSRTRDAVRAIRHIFLDADRHGPRVLAGIAERPDLPPPSYLLHSSRHRVHILWRVDGFSTGQAEALQKQLARELGTDRAATSCAQLTRLPGFRNHKYASAPVVRMVYGCVNRVHTPADFPPVVEEQAVGVHAGTCKSSTGARMARARRYLDAVPPAVEGQHGDLQTFRVCCRLVRGFALDDEEALSLLRAWNDRCVPPWTERELRAKIAHARRHGREEIGRLLRYPA